MVSYPGVILAFVFLDNILSNFKKYTKTGKAFSGIIFMVIFTILTNFSATVVYSFFAEQNVQLRFKKDIIFKYNFRKSRFCSTWRSLLLYRNRAKRFKEIPFICRFIYIWRLWEDYKIYERGKHFNMHRKNTFWKSR